MSDIGAYVGFFLGWAIVGIPEALSLMFGKIREKISKVKLGRTLNDNDGNILTTNIAKLSNKVGRWNHDEVADKKMDWKSFSLSLKRQGEETSKGIEDLRERVNILETKINDEKPNRIVV